MTSGPNRKLLRRLSLYISEVLRGELPIRSPFARRRIDIVLLDADAAGCVRLPTAAGRAGDRSSPSFS